MLARMAWFVVRHAGGRVVRRGPCALQGGNRGRALDEHHTPAFPSVDEKTPVILLLRYAFCQLCVSVGR